MRKILDSKRASEGASRRIDSFFPDVVTQVEQALDKHDWVVVGMAQNPFVKKARKLLESEKLTFNYIEHGNYFSKWKERLAIKLWSGWPTFPQVFHRGQLVGGFDELQRYMQNLKTTAKN